MSKNMTAIIPTNYQGQAISFNEDGWFNATEAAARFGKNPYEWLRLDSTKEYVDTLNELSNCEDFSQLDANSNTGKSRIWTKTKRGQQGGTWMHPDLAVPFARWLDARFAIWCDRQIKSILAGSHPRFDWKRMRSEASSSFNPYYS